MDKLDIKILQILVDDAMIPFSELAKRLSVSTDTAIRHYNKLKESGIIKKSTIIIDLSKCGYNGYFGFFIELNGRVDSDYVEQELNKIPNCSLIMRSTPPFNLYAEFFVRTFDEITYIAKGILNIKGVRKSILNYYPMMGHLVYQHPYQEVYQALALVLPSEKVKTK